MVLWVLHSVLGVPHRVLGVPHRVLWVLHSVLGVLGDEPHGVALTWRSTPVRVVEESGARASQVAEEAAVNFL